MSVFFFLFVWGGRRRGREMEFESQIWVVAKDVIIGGLSFEPSSFYNHTHTTFLKKLGMRYGLFQIDMRENDTELSMVFFHLYKLTNMTQNLSQSHPPLKLPTSILYLHIFIFSNCKTPSILEKWVVSIGNPRNN